MRDSRTRLDQFMAVFAGATAAKEWETSHFVFEEAHRVYWAFVAEEILHLKGGDARAA